MFTSAKKYRFTAFLFFVMAGYSVYSQDSALKDPMSLPSADSIIKSGAILHEDRQKPEIRLSPTQSVVFLQHRCLPEHWKNPGDPLRQAIVQLVFEASHQPFDSAKSYFEKYPLDSLKVPWDKFYTWEQIKVRIPVIKKAGNAGEDSVKVKAKRDSLSLYEMQPGRLAMHIGRGAGLKDTLILVLVDTLHNVTSDYRGFPFAFYEYPFQGDSIIIAIRSLMDFIEARDSMLLNVTGSGNAVTPVWLNSRNARLQRYWLRNDLNDSVTVWMGSTSKNTLGLYLENGVSFRRPARQGDYPQARIDVREIDKSRLLNEKNIQELTQFWKFRTQSALTFDQASLSNWVQGGVSNIAAALDANGYADYEDKTHKITSNNFIRVNYGLIATSNASSSSGLQVKKNIDLLQTSSKIDHKAFGKFDFSAIFLFKTQLSKGYNYPNDSVPVSKFMNPAIITAGIGLDYKPDKNTSVDFSPLSYRGTFVLDPAHIDPTQYGLEAGKKAYNEIGINFLITNDFKPYKNIDIVDRLQLFDNYILNPQNVDVDWEMIGAFHLNWFTDLKWDLHLIYDDKTKTPIYDSHNNPILDANGNQKKTARIQFKEVIGLAFNFRL
ncbi:MAG: DUF3078 domain-containing protein [Bacteroidales bacterium]|jgi:hypothetical protein